MKDLHISLILYGNTLIQTEAPKLQWFSSFIDLVATTTVIKAHVLNVGVSFEKDQGTFDAHKQGPPPPPLLLVAPENSMIDIFIRTIEFRHSFILRSVC